MSNEKESFTSLGAISGIRLSGKVSEGTPVVAIKANYTIDEAYIPKRCRNPRYRKITGTTLVPIPVVKEDEAPVAMYHMRGLRCDGRYREDYRWFNGSLYIRKRNKYGTRNFGPVTLPQFKKMIQRKYERNAVRDEHYHFVHDIETAERCIRDMWADHIIIDNGKSLQVWEMAGEPRYYIITFGLGFNHGGIGTSVSIGNSYNPNIAKESYFTALQYNEAVQKALVIAKNRGDDKSYPFIRRTPKIHVLMPETVKCRPNEEAGDGCPIQKELEALCEGASSAFEAGLLVMASAASALK